MKFCNNGTHTYLEDKLEYKSIGDIWKNDGIRGVRWDGGSLFSGIQNMLTARGTGDPNGQFITVNRKE